MGEVVLNFSLGPSKAIFCYIKSLRHFTVNITKTLLAEFREVSSGRILEKGREVKENAGGSAMENLPFESQTTQRDEEVKGEMEGRGA